MKMCRDAGQWHCVLMCAFVVAGATAAQEKRPALAGWYDVYPQIKFGANSFQPHYQTPMVTKGTGDQAVYSQTVRYDVPTGLVRAFDFTVLRDAAIKVRYNAEDLRAQDEPPNEMKAGKYVAWTWKDGKVVVVLSEDSAVVMAKAPGSVLNFPVDQLSTVDWDRIARAVKKPPRTDFAPTVETFRVLAKGTPTAVLREWCGPASEAKINADGPGMHRWIYRLADGSRIIVNGGVRVETVRHETKDGEVVELVK